MAGTFVARGGDGPLTESRAMAIVQAELLGPDGLAVRIRCGESLDQAALTRLTTALAVLRDEWRHRSSVPKVIAAATVDLATVLAAGGRPRTEQQVTDIEDAVEELVALAYALFAIPVDVPAAADPGARREIARGLIRFVPRRDLGTLPPGAVVHDVSSRAKPPWVKLSPFYPHGGIPVPGRDGETADSVEGIWQGLKIIDGEIDPAYFVGRGRKRRGRPSGHQLGDEVLRYLEARERIYLPCYEYLWRECIGHDLRRLIFEPAARGVVQYFHDVDDNGDPADPSSPLAHSSLLARFAADELERNMGAPSRALGGHGPTDVEDLG